ncbi:DUF4232 domain-containing protein [Frankia sp. AgB1.9]|uniref:DUF4232 domain-containing protein n=1 Tax=unclassified Frankia TaxID=2632575 RepID=UPI001932CB58|nr:MULTISPECIES: DUF4232 domain-containing protein [unclassified Frankia]MBL7490271.1 DUF4232 domain-containing protein [Frankia sp. AgW1.1]MBL7549875.1 DUF4232 domain-containing protein [Frankia sp. AgB1.9]MBL7623009.1 DUF4232 domain-containing protein [Frankia sp. AgB1.8]
MRTDRVWAPPAHWRSCTAVALAAFGLVACAGCGSPATEAGTATVTASRSDYRPVAAVPARVVPATLSTDAVPSDAVATEGAIPVTAIPVTASDEAAAGVPSDTATAAAAVSPSAAQTTDLEPPAAVVAAAPVCPPRGLTGALRHTEGTAGHVYNDLVLRNKGTVACRLTGYPDVRFVDADGAAFGAPADDTDDGPATAVLLPAGGTATAMLRITQAGIQRGCTAASQTRLAAALRVTPPDGGTVTLSVPLSGGITACVSSSVRQLLIGPLTST